MAGGSWDIGRPRVRFFGCFFAHIGFILASFRVISRILTLFDRFLTVFLLILWGFFNFQWFFFTF
jgi:hypothetical protein